MGFDDIGVPAASRRGGRRDGHRVIAEPFDVFGEVRVAFVEVDSAPVLFVQPHA